MTSVATMIFRCFGTFRLLGSGIPRSMLGGLGDAEEYFLKSEPYWERPATGPRLLVAISDTHPHPVRDYDLTLSLISNLGKTSVACLGKDYEQELRLWPP